MDRMEDIIDRYRNEFILDRLKLGAPLPKVCYIGPCLLLLLLLLPARASEQGNVIGLVSVYIYIYIYIYICHQKKL